MRTYTYSHTELQTTHRRNEKYLSRTGLDWTKGSKVELKKKQIKVKYPETVWESETHLTITIQSNKIVEGGVFEKRIARAFAFSYMDLCVALS